MLVRSVALDYHEIRSRQVVIPRNKPIKAITMGGIVRDAGLTVEEFRELL